METRPESKGERKGEAGGQNNKVTSEVGWTFFFSED